MDKSFLALSLAAVLLAAGITDLRSGRIPNRLTISAMATGFLSHSFFDGLPGMLFSLKGLGLGFGLFLVFYLAGGMGAGDVKLLGAVGSFIGAEGVFSAGIMAMLLGGIYAMAMMISHEGVRAALKRTATILKSCILVPGSFGTSVPVKEQQQLRYALVIGLGTLSSQWMEVPFHTF
jgi:prepilin peptidase CpaA